MAKILLVEDHPDTRDIYRTIFEVEEHEVLEAADGPTGLEMAIEHEPDLVILDLGLPGLDGWGVLEKMRERPALQRVKVLIVTAHGDQETRKRVLRTTCDGLLIKPVEPRRLVRAAEQCLTNGDVWGIDPDPMGPS